MDADTIVEQLRELHVLGADGPMKEAADLIDRLRAIKKSDDGAYEHVVELYHDTAAEVERLNALIESWKPTP